MKNPIKVTTEELITILNSVENPTFVNIKSETEVRMRKTDNPYFKKVMKVRSGRYLIGSEYETRVNTNDKKEGGEGEFVGQTSKVGVHISKCVLYNEKLDTHYLSHEMFDEVKPKVEYIYEGNPIDKQLFEGFISQSSNYSNQPQERKVKWMTIKLDNIKEISLNGNVYQH